ncbi:MAG: DUF389 domain-containing protein [Pseudomonadota bacterium]
MAVLDTPPPARRTKAPQWWRYLRLLLRRLARPIDHNEVVEHVREEGHVTGRYIFMSVMSCGVATLGLLLSSPAVIIGAMLISPLMGPIMALGFSLTILEWSSLRRALVAQISGVFAAVAIAFVLVWISPLKEMTQEIVTRSRPNLFDLGVAVFSGLAGGYAVIHRKGETIVGVAIATALMPPLAVVGFGLAVQNWDVAAGAFFLFMTNLLAIAFCVVALSKLYGFGEEHSPRHTLWQSSLILTVFGALSLPLGVALGDIAYETTVSNQVRSRVLEPFPADDARLSEFSIAFPRDEIRVTATVMTHQPVPNAEEQLATLLNERFDRPVRVRLDQLIMNEGRSLEAEQLLALADNSLAAPLRAEIQRVEDIARRYATDQALAAAIPFPVKARDIDNELKIAVFVASSSDAYSLRAYREIEAGLTRNFNEWNLTVVPPITDLPTVPFAPGSGELDAAAIAALEDIDWTLARWQAAGADVTGHVALSSARSADLARARAEAVSTWLSEHGQPSRPTRSLRAIDVAAMDALSGERLVNAVSVRPRGGTAPAATAPITD